MLKADMLQRKNQWLFLYISKLTKNGFIRSVFIMCLHDRGFINDWEFWNIGWAPKVSRYVARMQN